jgi:hypothetical protein
VKQSASLYGIEIEKISPSLCAERFPSSIFPMALNVYMSPMPVFLIPENAIRLYAEQAKKHGAGNSYTRKGCLTGKKIATKLSWRTGPRDISLWQTGDKLPEPGPAK